MKKSNFVLTVVLLALLLVAWGICLAQGLSINKEYNAQLKLADQYNEKGLYQKAIACYDAALVQKDNKVVRERWAETYKKAYEDGVLESKQYIEVLDCMCSLYPKETKYWEDLLALYLEHSEYKNAYKCYTKCVSEGVESAAIKEYGIAILYSYSIRGRSYEAYVGGTLGYFTVSAGEKWGLLDAEGEDIYDNIYSYISPYGSTGEMLFEADGRQYIMNGEGVIEAKVDIDYKKTGAYADGLIPVCTENGTWRYLNCDTNSYLPDSYEQASNFSDGMAAVRKDGKWMLINKDAEQICQTAFSDVKLHENGDYQYGGVMVAAVNGEYGFYSEKGEPLGSFKAKNMEAYLGSYVAFADASGKWGFVKKTGEVIFEPQFAQAKSFSNNLAAVSDGQLWGYINKEGNVVIALQFVDAGYFTNKGSCMVSIDEGVYNLLKLRFAS